MFDSKKGKYKNQNNDKKMLIILFCIVISLAITYYAISNIDFSHSTESNEIDVNSFKTIEDVLKFYNCTFIKQEKSNEKDYDIDIYTTFSEKPYEDDEHINESFYTRLMQLSASVLNFQNFRIIDTRNDITVSVICANNNISKFYINGIEDYFTYIKSQISLKDYKELTITSFEVNSDELNNLLQNDWLYYNLNLGNSDGFFQKYDQYIEKGLKIRKLDKKIYNIVFTKNYTNPVINGIIVRDAFDLAKAKLGTPTFEDTENGVYGYKGKEFYVFITKEEISIYRIENFEYDEFINLIEEFSNGDTDIYQFLNKLTYLWSNYSEYIVKENSFYITYPLQGISVKCNYENTNAIILYNNVKMTSFQSSKCLEMPECLAQMQVDNVFEDEVSRVVRENSLLTECNKFIEANKTENNTLYSGQYGIYAEKDENNIIEKVYFVSKDSTRPNREINEAIDTFAWLNDSIFIYSINKKGIYYYDLQSNKRGKILTGEQDFKIASCYNNLLKYDNKEIQINF